MEVFYSWLYRIIYLKCTDNNRADTVLELFEKSVEYLGLPTVDRGDEMLVWLLTCWGPERSFIRGCVEKMTFLVMYSSVI